MRLVITLYDGTVIKNAKECGITFHTDEITGITDCLVYDTQNSNKAISVNKRDIESIEIETN